MTSTRAKRFTIEEYHRLTDLGFFTEDDRIELIRGEIIQMAAKGTPHTVCCSNLLGELAALVANQATLRCQDPIILRSDSEPEPDFVIARKRADNYLSAHPNPADILLVIEIADSTLKYDREVKVPLYAEAGISDYWLFNLVENHLEAYSEPYQELQGSFGYSMKRIVLPNQAIALPFLPELSLDLSQVFPRIGE
jgi:Uma2 family endonuclease